MVSAKNKVLTKIGAITPTYNRPNLLLRLHESIQHTGEGVDWIHCGVDDGSKESYQAVVEQCAKASGLMRYKRIQNSGALIARNHALDMAIDEGCTHFCFVDDDDYLIRQGLLKVSNRLEEFSDQDWFVFKSKKNIAEAQAVWPDKPARYSWFNDIVINQRFGSDNFVVVSASLVGKTRFTLRGRNQREWTFFHELSAKNDTVIVCPDTILHVEYQNDGLSNCAHNAAISSPEQIMNSMDRAFQYWLRRPTSLRLTLRLVRQLLSGPVKFIRYWSKF